LYIPRSEQLLTVVTRSLNKICLSSRDISGIDEISILISLVVLRERPSNEAFRVLKDSFCIHSEEYYTKRKKEEEMLFDL
jgi:hypothetical protein